MIARLDNHLEQCPDECRYALIVVDDDKLRTTKGVAGVNVTVNCVYREICKYRQTGAE